MREQKQAHVCSLKYIIIVWSMNGVNVLRTRATVSIDVINIRKSYRL